MAELLTTTQDTWTTVHPWYQLFKHRLHHIDVNHIIMVPNVPVMVDEDLRKKFKKEGMLVPIVIDNNNLLIEGSRRLQYFKNEGSHVLAYKAKNNDEEKFLIELNKKCIELHPNIFDWGFMFEKDMRKYTDKVLPLLQEGIQPALVN